MVEFSSRGFSSRGFSRRGLMIPSLAIARFSRRGFSSRGFSSRGFSSRGLMIAVLMSGEYISVVWMLVISAGFSSRGFSSLGFSRRGAAGSAFKVMVPVSPPGIGSAANGAEISATSISTRASISVDVTKTVRAAVEYRRDGHVQGRHDRPTRGNLRKRGMPSRRLPANAQTVAPDVSSGVGDRQCERPFSSGSSGLLFPSAAATRPSSNRAVKMSWLRVPVRSGMHAGTGWLGSNRLTVPSDEESGGV